MEKRKKKSEGVVIGGEDHKNYIDFEKYLKLKRENEELKEENVYLKIQVENLEPNYENWYNLINWERKDREDLTKRLTIDVLILITALVIQSFLILLK